MQTDEGISYYLTLDEKGNVYSELYGADDFTLGRLCACDFELSREELKEKLDSGKYILEGVPLDDNGKVMWDTAHFQKGDKVTLVHSVTGKKHTYEVLGHVEQKHWTNTNRVLNAFPFYTSKKGYDLIADEEKVMSYAFNCEEKKEKEMASFLKIYTEQTEPTMDYETKFEKEEEFKQFQVLFLAIGGALSLLIGLIGILVPYLSCRTLGKESLVDRIREAE